MCVVKEVGYASPPQNLRRILECVDPRDTGTMLALCLASTAFYGPPAAFQQQRMASPLAREKPVQLATSIKGTPIWE
jgi:hypothetical protein